MFEPIVGALAVITLSFLPPILLAVRLRRLERDRPEPWRTLALAFAWGASGAIAISVLVETRLIGGMLGIATVGFIGLVLAAPIIEELAKAIVLPFLPDDDPEPEDGLIYGGVVGLGFAATENVFYILLAFSIAGVTGGLATAIFRAIATVALHGAAGALSGHGAWRARRTGRRLAFVLPVAGAIALHAAYNFLTSIGLLLATGAALVLGVLAYLRVTQRIRDLDARS